jgi:hypothetical protein
LITFFSSRSIFSEFFKTLRQSLLPTSGRVLLQIDAQPGGNKLEKPREPIDVNELKRVQPYLVSRGRNLDYEEAHCL